MISRALAHDDTSSEAYQRQRCDDHGQNGGTGSAVREVSTRLPVLDRTVRSVCPYCGVGCQIDLQVKDEQVIHVKSPWIEEDTPNQGSTCVKGRFGYDFAQHRDRLTIPLIRRGWKKAERSWVYDAVRCGAQRRWNGVAATRWSMAR